MRNSLGTTGHPYGCRSAARPSHRHRLARTGSSSAQVPRADGAAHSSVPVAAGSTRTPTTPTIATMREFRFPSAATGSGCRGGRTRARAPGPVVQRPGRPRRVLAEPAGPVVRVRGAELASAGLLRLRPAGAGRAGRASHAVLRRRRPHGSCGLGPGAVPRVVVRREHGLRGRAGAPRAGCPASSPSPVCRAARSTRCWARTRCRPRPASGSGITGTALGESQAWGISAIASRIPNRGFVAEVLMRTGFIGPPPGAPTWTP